MTAARWIRRFSVTFPTGIPRSSEYMRDHVIALQVATSSSQLD
ncbi:MAG: hypothetical protein U0P48_13970 [Ancrocorticia sp.]